MHTHTDSDSFSTLNCSAFCFSILQITGYGYKSTSIVKILTHFCLTASIDAVLTKFRF